MLAAKVEQSERFLGKVKWFNGSRGFGFITNLKTETDVFCHHSGLKTSMECWKTLYEGEYIEYELRKDKEGQDQATNVTGVLKGPLLCETRHVQQSRNPGGRPRFRPSYRNNYRQKDGDDDTKEVKKSDDAA